ncbi:agglutinin-2 [Selaginella moellendorffii]|nr:agglutinin-2 [Selaginella moellendorffii]|eukprot:XP_002978395.2 agglutinin-2 [Selaginella moellendorffii]
MDTAMLQLWRMLLLAALAALQALAWELERSSGGGDRAEPASFYFTDFEDNLQDLSLLGDAKFVRIEGQADGMAVQLSGTRKNTVGRLLYSIPVNMLDLSNNPASFSTFFEFSMTAFAGDGLAFVIVPDKISIGASGPWLGLVKEDEISNRTAMAPHTFAVEFDSVMNMELRDPNSNHVGLDVETIVSTVTANASDIGLILNDGSRTFAWIQFDGSSSELDVRISKDRNSRPTKPLLSHKVDLKSVLRPWMYVGFSSSTGEASQKHKVFSWKFSSGGSSSPSSSSRRRWRNEILLQGIHSLPANPLSPSIAKEGEDGSSEAPQVLDDHTSSLVILVVGFTCGASVTLFLLAGWALMRSRFDHNAYQEIN